MNASNGMTNGLTGAASGGGQNWRLVAAQQSQPSVSRSNSVVAGKVVATVANSLRLLRISQRII